MPKKQQISKEEIAQCIRPTHRDFHSIDGVNVDLHILIGGGGGVGGI